MRVGSEVAEEPAAEVISLVVPVTLERAPPALANVQDLHDTLAHLGAFQPRGRLMTGPPRSSFSSRSLRRRHQGRKAEWNPLGSLV